MGTSLQEVKVITCTTTKGLVKKDPAHLRKKCKHKHLPQHACSHILHFWCTELQSEPSRIFTHSRIDNECRRGKSFYRRVSGPCNSLPPYLHGGSLIPDWSPSGGRTSCLSSVPTHQSQLYRNIKILKKKTFKRTKLRCTNRLLKSHSHAHKTHTHSCALTHRAWRP